MEITAKAARVNAGLTQKKAAKSLGISENTLIGYEKGRQSPRFDMVKKMSILYGVAMNDLVFFESDST